MRILTNGRDFLHATTVMPPAPFDAELDVSRSEILGYGPVQDSVAPQRRTEWWGRFEEHETVQVEIQRGPTRGLHVEVLDEDFHRIASRPCSASITRLRIRIERAGVHYVRVTHGGESQGRFLLRVLQICPLRIEPSVHPKPSIASRLWNFLIRRAEQEPARAAGIARTDSA
jgi:hypothetical protein